MHIYTPTAENPRNPFIQFMVRELTTGVTGVHNFHNLKLSGNGSVSRMLFLSNPPFLRLVSVSTFILDKPICAMVNNIFFAILEVVLAVHLAL